ncbi:hypothetical protein GO495_06785 [Chitinophaga oryziterrae]|uniref:Redoxin domain-containing protein n=1 Tax=Chitinophaga oryziterrae TaxID=1031224 RepID=A0A6N8J6M4_9BACT|nr:hypothetical protein [Chitinophaga oryziterrae]MVT40281.1 hypothetical protein [Chitinophaga oryziterrae]
MFKYIFLFLIAVVGLSCRQRSVVKQGLVDVKQVKPVQLKLVGDSSLALEFDTLMGNKGKRVKDGYYLIIQVDGCSHCVDTTVAFSLHHLNSDKITFILTSEMGGIKVFKDKYSDDQLKANNLVLDGESAFIRKKFCSGLMCLMTVDGGHLVSMTSLMYDDIAENLAWLENRLR